AKASVSYGSRARGFELSFVEPYLLGQRLALGLNLFHKEQTSSQYTSYTTKTTGGSIRLGIPVTDNLTAQVQYQAYRQEIKLPLALNNCNNLAPDGVSTFPTPGAAGGIIDPTTGLPFATNCYADGEASLAVRRELAQGAVFVSAPGLALTFNTLNQNKNPTGGILAEVKQDYAGLGGDVKFIRTTADFRHYYEVTSELINVVRLQAGHITGWGGRNVRMLDHFSGGPNLVRGFQPSGFGPRDLTPFGRQDPLGGTIYWAATLEFQSPLGFIPKDIGLRAAIFADAGQLWNYDGPTTFPTTGEVISPLADSKLIRSSVGVGLIWDSPFGPLRFDIAYALSKEPYDRKQLFRFGGGTRF
ncbi:MAG: BamA/TamA family outer membrane protein, partial [Proteobacteria bacterium]|nr:BamA/TamA family outer membrane protein [Pseudomonadota bacterium]